LRSDPTRNTISDEEQKVVERIIMLNYQEEIMWKQHSRITWLCEGDSNTNFSIKEQVEEKRKIELSS
jgi:N6-adenosine-specific RNA methylase IME4